MSLSVVDVVRACVQTQRTPIDIARERGAFRMLKRLHGAVNQQGQAKHLFKDEAMWVLLLLLPGLRREFAILYSVAFRAGECSPDVLCGEPWLGGGAGRLERSSASAV